MADNVRKAEAYFICVLIVLSIGLSFYSGYLLKDTIKYGIMLENAGKEQVSYQVAFDGEVLYRLSQTWSSTGNKEFAVCLIGEIDGNLIIIDDFDNFILGNNDSVHGMDCLGANHVGLLHKHPNKNKHLSHTDTVSSFIRYYTNDELVYIVQYEENRFNIFTRNNWIVGKEYQF